VTGLLVAPQDVVDLTACLRRVLDQPLVMQRFAQDGKVAIQRDFTWSAHAETLAAVCAEATGVRI
jgi:glycosyltransferase involved in cell wall biosynthesis